MKRCILYRFLCVAMAAASVAFGANAQSQIVAHRGYWKAANGAQNSIESFNRADSIGVYGSEFDVWLTACDSLVVDHDPIFKGVDMRTAPLDSILAVELANGETLPTLRSYLENAVKHPNIRLVLELKPLKDFNREDLAAKKVVAMLREYGLLDRTDIISFSINACLAFVKENAGLPVYYLDGDLTPKRIKQLGLAGMDYHHSVYDAHPDWIEKAHELGLKVNVWTVDKPADIERFALQGVDFITTNNPETPLPEVQK